MNRVTQTKKQQRLMLPLIDYIIIGAFLFYLFFIWKNHPFSIGGSLIFINIIGFGYYLSIVHKEFSSDISNLCFIFFLLMVLNYLGYIEYVEGFSKNVLIGTIATVILMLIAILHLIQKPFSKDEIYRMPERIELLRRVSGFIGSKMFAVLGFIVATASIFMVLKEEPIVKKHFFSITIFSILWILIGLISLSINKRKAVDNALPLLVIKKSELNIIPFRRKFFWIAIVIFILGSIFEIPRGFWILWISSWLTAVLVIVVLWKIWKHVFLKTSTSDILKINGNVISAIPNVFKASYCLKYIGFFTLIGVFYVFMLFAIWYFWGR